MHQQTDSNQLLQNLPLKGEGSMLFFDKKRKTKQKNAFLKKQPGLPKDKSQ